MQYNLDAAYHLTFEMTTLLLEMGSSGKRATGGASGSTLCFSCVEDFCLLLSHNQHINQPIHQSSNLSVLRDKIIDTYVLEYSRLSCRK